MTTRYLICGGRAFLDREMMDRALANLIRHPADAVIIHGAASGADGMAAAWGERNGVKEIIAYPITSKDWDLYGNAAGPLRNKEMLDKGKPDVVLAFPGGRGTADMVRQARARQKERNTYGGPPLVVIEIVA